MLSWNVLKVPGDKKNTKWTTPGPLITTLFYFWSAALSGCLRLWFVPLIKKARVSRKNITCCHFFLSLLTLGFFLTQHIPRCLWPVPSSICPDSFKVNTAHHSPSPTHRQTPTWPSIQSPIYLSTTEAAHCISSSPLSIHPPIYPSFTHPFLLLRCLLMR